MLRSFKLSNFINQMDKFNKSFRWLSYTNYVLLATQGLRLAFSVFGLGLVNFAVFTLLTSNVQLFHKMFGINSWTATLKTLERVKRDSQRYSALALLLIFELFSVFLCFVLLYIFIHLYLVSLNDEISNYTWYLFVILFQIDGVAVGFLKYKDKEYLISTTKILSAIFSFAGVVFCTIYYPEIKYYLLVSFVTIVFSRFVLVLILISELLRKIGTINIFSVADKFLYKDVVYCSIESTVRAVRDFDLNLVFLFFGLEMTSIYKLARRVADAANSLSGPLYYAYFRSSVAKSDRHDRKKYSKIRNNIFGIQFLLASLLLIFSFSEIVPNSAASVCMLASVFVLSFSIWTLFQRLHADIHIMDKNGVLSLASLTLTIGYLFMISIVGSFDLYNFVGIPFLIYYCLWVLVAANIVKLNSER